MTSVESKVEVKLVVNSLSDDQLAQGLSRNLAVFIMHLDGTQEVSVECLTQLLWQTYSNSAMMIVQRFDADGDSNDMMILQGGRKSSSSSSGATQYSGHPSTSLERLVTFDLEGYPSSENAWYGGS